MIGSRRPARVVIACLAWFCFVAVAGAAWADQVAHFPAADQPWSARNYVDFYFAQSLVALISPRAAASNAEYCSLIIRAASGNCSRRFAHIGDE